MEDFLKPGLLFFLILCLHIVSCKKTVTHTTSLCAGNEKNIKLLGQKNYAAIFSLDDVKRVNINKVKKGKYIIEIDDRNKHGVKEIRNLSSCKIGKTTILEEFDKRTNKYFIYMFKENALGFYIYYLQQKNKKTKKTIVTNEKVQKTNKQNDALAFIEGLETDMKILLLPIHIMKH